jgi:hypothetical protein
LSKPAEPMVAGTSETLRTSRASTTSSRTRAGERPECDGAERATADCAESAYEVRRSRVTADRSMARRMRVTAASRNLSRFSAGKYWQGSQIKSPVSCVMIAKVAFDDTSGNSRSQTMQRASTARGVERPPASLQSRRYVTRVSACK